MKRYTMLPENRYEYTERQEKTGFKTGDKVLILRKAEKGKNGWDFSYWNPDMDATIGQIGTIVQISPQGIFVSNPLEEIGWCYPYFLLRRI